MAKATDRILGFFSSLGLSCTLLILLGILTFLGTLDQVDNGLYAAQKKYFESFFLIHWQGALPIPLPGANLVLCILAVNLLVGGMLRLRRGTATVGVLIVHVGIAMLLLSGFIKMYHSEDGAVQLYEGQQKDVFRSYYDWEIAIHEDLGEGRTRVHVAPQEAFLPEAKDGVTLTSPALPFDLELSGWMVNANVLPKGPRFEVDVPVVDGAFLRELDRDKEAERNLAGVYATVVEADGTRQEGILWGVQMAPWTVTVDGKRYGIDLRHEEFPMPFAVRLDKFTKEDHGRISMARSFSSDVTVFEAGTSRAVEISMNEPLRDGGLVLYQASWGPQGARPGDRLFSVLAVVRNPADQYPLYGCIVISIGLVFHFGRKLLRYIRIEAKRL